MIEQTSTDAPPAIETEPPTPGQRRGIVVYGSVPWDTPWLNDQNLAHALSRRANVLFVEPPLSPLSPLRRNFRLHRPADGREVVRGKVRSRYDVKVFRPFSLPPVESPRMSAASTAFVRAQIRRAVAQAGLATPVAIAMRPALAGAAGERLHITFVSDWVEAGERLLGRKVEDLAAANRRAWRQSDIVCATSPALQSSLAARGVTSVLVPHAFHSELAPLYEDPEPPAEYQALPRPILGYTGQIDARLSFKALRAVARRLPHASIVLLGPISPRLDRTELSQLMRLPNVHWLDERYRTALPAYITHLDCCLLPYRSCEWVLHGSPMKLWDYLYAGPPIAGSACPILAEYPPPLVHFSQDEAHLPDMVEAALASGDEARAARRDRALANTWDQRADQLLELISAREPR